MSNELSVLSSAINNTSSNRRHEENKLLSVPIPIPASFSTISTESQLGREMSTATNALTPSLGRGRRGGVNQNSQMSHNRRLSNLVHHPLERPQHYQPSLSLHQSESNQDWGTKIDSNLTASSQNHSQKSIGTRADIESIRPSERDNIASQPNNSQLDYHANTNSSLDPPPHPITYPSPQIAALAAAAAYHPLWPTYRAAAAAAAAQAQMAAVAAASVSSASTPGSSAFSRPLKETSSDSGSNSNNTNIASQPLSNLVNSPHATPTTPYFPSQNPLFNVHFNSSSIQGPFSDSRHTETAAGTSLFTPYHPYHLAAAAAFASSQMIELQRSFAMSQNSTNSLSIMSATPEEDMPSSTTQEHSPIVNNESPTNNKGEEQMQAFQTPPIEKNLASSTKNKQRNSRNPYSIDEILREEEESTTAIESNQTKFLNAKSFTSSCTTTKCFDSGYKGLDKGDEDKFNGKSAILQNSKIREITRKRNHTETATELDEYQIMKSPKMDVRCERKPNIQCKDIEEIEKIDVRKGPINHENEIINNSRKSFGGETLFSPNDASSIYNSKEMRNVELTNEDQDVQNSNAASRLPLLDTNIT